MCAAPVVVVLDSNLVAVALPSIRRELGGGHDDVQWVLGGFSLAFGAALLPAARAVDVGGARGPLCAGLTLFALAAAGCALAPSLTALIGLRMAQGLGAALALPASLALITSSFPEGVERRRALGRYGAAVSAAFLGGVLLGGLLVLELGWRAAVASEATLAGPAAVAALTLPRASIGERAAPGDRRASPAGGRSVALGLAAAAALGLYGLGALTDGQHGVGAGSLVVAVVLGSRAWAGDRRARVPLVPSTLRASPTLRRACLAAFLTVATGTGAMFVLSLLLQEQLGLSPLGAGAALSALGAAGIATGLLLPGLTHGARLPFVLAATLGVQALGTAVLGLFATAGLAAALPAAALIGAGHFGATVAFTSLAATGIPPDRHGIAMGMLGSSQQLGGAVGLAVLTSAAATAAEPVDGLRIALAGATAMSLTAAVAAVSRPRRG